MKIKTVIQLSILCTISTSLIAGNEKETWECKDPNGEWNNVLVTATANKTTGEGSIKVAGVEHLTKFEIAGFDRQWRFGKVSVVDHDKYIFRIQPNGVARYYNMPATKTGGSVATEMVLHCRSLSSGWSVKLPQKLNNSIETKQTLSPCLPGLFILNYDE